MDVTATELSRATTLLIQVKVAPSARDDFASKYREATGTKPQGEAFIVEKRRDGRKLNCEIWFSAPETVAGNLKMLGYEPTDFQKGDFKYLVDSEALFWKLVRNGFRIGQRQAAMAQA